jgi:hypothetical protein
MLVVPRCAGGFAAMAAQIPRPRDEAHPLPGPLQFKKDPQTVQERGLVFALFSLVLAVGNRLFQ